MASNRIAIIMGAGPRVGGSVAEKLTKEGYKVATASRSGTGSKSNSGILSLKADFSKPESIPPLFEAVKSELGDYPSVVVYNAAGMTPPPKEVMFSIPTEKVDSDLKINTVSPYAAAQEAVKGWEMLPKEIKKSFIYTGNILNVAVLPVAMMTTLGVGKAASAYWIGTADQVYTKDGYRFFYADERFADGKLKGMEIDGPAHADFYAQLADHQVGVPWHATFVKGQGYVKF